MYSTNSPPSPVAPSYCDRVFVHFVNLQDSVTLRDGHSYLIQDPRATDRPFGVGEVLTRPSYVLFGGARPTQAEQKLFVTPERQHGMIGRKYRAFYQSFHLKTCPNVFTRVAHVHDVVSNRKLEILADVRLQTHHVAILDCFFFVLRDLVV